MAQFTHLHVHTQYSILDGASAISKLIKKTKELGMNSIAITDHGYMYGVKEFYNTAKKEGVKPIIGVETYVARRTLYDKDKNNRADRSGHHLILLAKNKIGYKNLIKLSSVAATDGFYYKPRIDKQLLEKHREGLIALSACIGGELAQKALKENEKAAEKALLWYKNLFGKDFYVELQRHQTGNPKQDNELYDKQIQVGEILTKLAEKHNVKIIATNDLHFINKEDAEAHDRLICLNTGKDFNDPTRMRYTKEEYLKTQEEMAALFADLPEAIENTQEIANKIEDYEIDSQPIMPDFSLPKEFNSEDAYLKHITYEGAKKRWKEITPEIKERLDFELETIKKMGFPGYFLIVWDLLKAARELGVRVGPGRGSAAGSAVAYCTKITDIDPLKYNLLFERFLNPDRISMPDIDIDFDDDGREKVLDWTVKKYGKEKVAHIITFGTMAAKMAIRDIARVQKLPLPDADYLAKLVPDTPGTTLEKAYKEVPELAKEKKSPNELRRLTLQYAEQLEGAVRQTGVHACGIIIGRDNLNEHIPLCQPKDANLLATQYEGNFVEQIGMLKMDFLGLKTLSIIKDTVDNIKLSKNIEIDIDNLPFEDSITYQLFAKGETTGIFQFESAGMKKHLKQLQPTRFEDLVAMNALYRPGPMEYIPSFTRRKHGKESINYDHPMMEEYLQETYGITVFQEQVMLLARKLANFTRGQSDSLRKAMGKKIASMMAELKKEFIAGCNNNPKFIEGCKEKEPNKLIEKIWRDWEAFTKYAFNKSHSVCYAYLAYQTAYLKAHYPAEFMAAILSRNLNNIDKIATFMDECKQMECNVTTPDINQSHVKFTVDNEGNIRFGMAGIKNVGKNAVEEIIKEREKNGKFKDIYDFIERVDTYTVNKKNLEALATAGGFDSFKDIHRSQYIEPNDKNTTFIEELTKYGSKIKEGQDTTQTSLFGGDTIVQVQKPQPPQMEEWNVMEKLNREKELVGIYLSAHPLQDYQFEMQNYCKTKLSQLQELSQLNGKDITVGGMVVKAVERTSKNGNIYGVLTLEGFTGSHEFFFFPKDYVKYKNFFTKGSIIAIKGKVQPRYSGNDYEVKINNIMLLSEIKEKISKVAINIPLSTLTPEFINQFHQLTQNNQGKVTLYFKVYDDETNINVDLFSVNQRVNLSIDFIKYFEKNNDLQLKIK